MAATKAYKGVAMEGIIASWYAKTTFKDMKRHRSMAAQMAEWIPAGGKVLEVAPGPGYFCLELAKLNDYDITGLDISRSFVEIARANAERAGVPVDFRQGNASAMPFREETFDFIFCQAAFKNFSEPVEAISEMHRVLKPGGLAVIADLRHDASPEEIDQEIRGMRLNGINEALTRAAFKMMLLKTAYGVDEMRAMVARTPFADAEIRVEGVGFQFWLKKPQALTATAR